MTGTAPGTGRRILFVLLHLGYVRNYERPLRLLLERGHVIHLAVLRRKDDASDRVAERLAAEYPNLTIGVLPKPARTGAATLQRALRVLADYGRYQHPRYAGAPALKARAADKLRAGAALPFLALRAYLRTLGRILHPGYSRRLTRGALRLADALPAAPATRAWMAAWRPDAVLTTPHLAIGSREPEALDAARELGIASGLLVASWDNLTNKGLVKSETDLVVVWNEPQRREAVELHGVRPERVAITGAQRFDDWFELRASTDAEAFKRQVGLRPDRPYVLYLCSSPFIAPDEVSFVDRLARTLRAADGALAEAGLLIRPHPQNAEQWRDVDPSAWGNATVWPRAGAQPVDSSSKAGFFDSIHHSLAVVGINTSAQIEAGILGKSVHTVLDPAFATTQEGTLHFQHLLAENGGLLHIAGDLPGLVEDLRAALDGRIDPTQTLRFVADFVRPHGLDVPCSPIVADAVERLAHARTAVRPAQVAPATALLLRGVALLSTPRLPRSPARGAVRHARRWGVIGAGRVLARAEDVPALAPLTGPVRRAAERRQDLVRRAAGVTGAPGPGTAGVAEAQSAGVRRAVRPAAGEAPATVVVEPWPGDLAAEILYWIPSLLHAARRWDPRTQVLLATGSSDPAWYGAIGGRPLDAVAPAPADREWTARDRRALEEALRAAGHGGPVAFWSPQPTLALAARIRAGTQPLHGALRELERRPLIAGARPARAADGGAGAGPSLLRALAGDGGGTRPAAVVRDADGATQALAAADLADRIALTATITSARVVATTDTGVAALAIGLGTPAVLIDDGAGTGDVDVLERLAGRLGGDLTVVPAPAAGLLAQLRTGATADVGGAGR